MQTETIQFNGWKSLKISNGIIDLVVTLDIGPRVARLGFVGQDNEFCEFPAQIGLKGGDEWHSYGGHRLWHAPEVMPRTYYPDNFPVKMEDHKTFIRFISDPEKGNNMQKEIDIELVEGKSQVKVTHRIRNLGLWPVQYALWALSVMRTTGVAIVPIPERKPHGGNFVPSNLISIWPVTDMSDPRYTWGKQFVLFKQDDNHGTPQKFGMTVPDGWGAYACKGHIFIKQISGQGGPGYTDNGCNFEFYNEAGMAELESLSPFQVVEPGQAAEHFELWTLLDGVPQPATEADVVNNVIPKIKEIVSKKL